MFGAPLCKYQCGKHVIAVVLAMYCMTDVGCVRVFAVCVCVFSEKKNRENTSLLHGFDVRWTTRKRICHDVLVYVLNGNE